MIAHDVIQPGDHPQTLCDFGMHRAIDIVQQTERLAYQLVPLLQVTLVNFTLTSRIEIIRVRSSWIYVFHHRKNIQDILLIEDHFIFRFEIVVSEEDLNAGFKTERSQQRDFLKIECFDGNVDIDGLEVVVEMVFQI